MFSTIKKVLVAGALVLATAVGSLDDCRSPATYVHCFQPFELSHQSSVCFPDHYTYWGSDRLGSDIFYPNYRFDLSVTPGWYDIKLVTRMETAVWCAMSTFVTARAGPSPTGTLLTCELFSGR
jgi:hypothetical protein